MKKVLLGLTFVAMSATVAGAFECPTLQAQVDKQIGKRFDRQAAGARSLAAEAMALHKAGKHADSVKKYDEAAKAAAVQLTHKK